MADLQKSHAKPQEDIDAGVPAYKCAPEIQWEKNPNWTYTLIAYLSNHVSFRLKLFSNLTATNQGCLKHMAKDRKARQYAILAEHIFATEPGQSAFYLQNPGRFGTAVETHLQRYNSSLCIFILANIFFKP